MYSGLLPKGLSDVELSSDEPADDVYDDVSKGCENKGDVGDKRVSSDNIDNPPVVENVSPTSSLPGISSQMWQKFQELQKKRNEMKTMEKCPRRRKRRRHKKADDDETVHMESDEKRKQGVEHEKHWNELEQYFGVNDRFQHPACSSAAPQSGLEKTIDRSIAEGEFAKAEEMSDRLATRELAVKIAQAADCRDFVQSKKEEEASRATQKRKKQIAWGFEAKRRWETKSNMGYM